MFDEKSVSQLIAILSKKKDMVLSLLDITKKQDEIVGSNDLRSLNRCLNERQVIIGKLEALQKDLLALREEYTPYAWLLPRDNQSKLAVSGLEEEIDSMLREIQGLDQETASKVKEYSHTLQAELKRNNDNKMTISKYNFSDAVLQPEMFDKKG